MSASPVNRAVWVLLLAAGCAACYGAWVQTRRGGNQPQVRGADGQDPTQTIDKARAPKLDCVEAPEDVGRRAMEHVRTIVSFGPRHPGKPAAPGWAQQVEYIAAELQRLGLQAQRDTWTDRKELITFTNVRATIPGKRPERILLACHHDTKCTQGHANSAHNFHFVGANDGASAVGLILAMVPALRALELDATLELVFFDGEESLDWSWNEGERALFGSKRYVQRHRDAELTGESSRILAVVLLDMVGRKDLHIQEELYSTYRLRELTYAAARACRHEAKFFRAAEAASDDHKPFLDVGIPAVDLIDLTGNPYWHTPQDVVENMSVESLQVTADVVLTLLPAVQAEYLPKEK